MAWFHRQPSAQDERRYWTQRGHRGESATADAVDDAIWAVDHADKQIADNAMRAIRLEARDRSERSVG